jgi:hypothetical protein
MAKKTTQRYRDSKTGRFTSKATWQRSRAHGGKRYRRQSVKFQAGRRKPVTPKMRPRALPTPEFIEREIRLEEEFEEYDIEFGVDYKAKKGKR